MNVMLLSLFLIGSLFGYALGIIRHKKLRDNYFKTLEELANLKINYKAAINKINRKQAEIAVREKAAV